MNISDNSRTTIGSRTLPRTATCTGSVNRFRRGSKSAPAGTQYEWLADLAQLEWACESAWAAADGLPLPLATLGEVPPEQLAALVLSLHPSVRL